ncbi:Serine/threonine-protein kinase [Nymphaea thermarum]|nr:Serine/threonine-protein kinase [Nymphaea thermarum]
MANKWNQISSIYLSSKEEEDDDDEEEEEEEDREEYRKGGYHFVLPGDQFFGSRYVAQKKLGWGNFSTVWLAYDTETKKFVALKIQKSAQNFTVAALEEIEILRAISDGDPKGSKGVVKLLHHFNHTGPNGSHVCMVFELLGESLLKLLRYNRYRGLPLPKVKDICHGILLGLDYLHRELRIIHTDLKPENVMLTSSIDPAKDPHRSGLIPILERPEKKMNGGTIGVAGKKLRKKVKKPAETEKVRSLEGIDFSCKIVDVGNACWKDKKFSAEIQTRQYRAPEVILGYDYNEAVDMWSFACVAFEIATGDMLFEPKNGEGFECDQDHLALMIELLGKVPRKIAVGGSRSKDFFDRYGDLKNIKRLRFWPLIKVLIEKYKFTEADANEFVDFLSPLLDFAPEKRPTAAQCLQHPWILSRKSAADADKNVKPLENIEVGVSKLNIKEVGVGKPSVKEAGLSRQNIRESGWSKVNVRLGK